MTIKLRSRVDNCLLFLLSVKKTAGKILTVEIPSPNPPATCSVATVNSTTKNTPLTTCKPSITPSDQSQTCGKENAPITTSTPPNITVERTTNNLDSTSATLSRAHSESSLYDDSDIQNDGQVSNTHTSVSDPFNLSGEFQDTSQAQPYLITSTCTCIYMYMYCSSSACLFLFSRLLIFGHGGSRTCIQSE